MVKYDLAGFVDTLSTDKEKALLINKILDSLKKIKSLEGICNFTQEQLLSATKNYLKTGYHNFLYIYERLDDENKEKISQEMKDYALSQLSSFTRFTGPDLLKYIDLLEDLLPDKFEKLVDYATESLDLDNIKEYYEKTFLTERKELVTEILMEKGKSGFLADAILSKYTRDGMIIQNDHFLTSIEPAKEDNSKERLDRICEISLNSFKAQKTSSKELLSTIEIFEKNDLLDYSIKLCEDAISFGMEQTEIQNYLTKEIFDKHMALLKEKTSNDEIESVRKQKDEYSLRIAEKEAKEYERKYEENPSEETLQKLMKLYDILKQPEKINELLSDFSKIEVHYGNYESFIKYFQKTGDQERLKETGEKLVRLILKNHLDSEIGKYNGRQEVKDSLIKRIVYQWDFIGEKQKAIDFLEQVVYDNNVYLGERIDASIILIEEYKQNENQEKIDGMIKRIKDTCLYLQEYEPLRNFYEKLGEDYKEQAQQCASIIETRKKLEQ